MRPLVSKSSARRHAMVDPDVHLMLRVREGDGEAFTELMRRYQNRVLLVLEHLVGDRDWAEDLAQEVFLRVYRARKTYTADAKFITWLFTITNHVASNALRTKARRREVRLRPAANSSGSGRPLERLLQCSSGQIPARQLDKAEMRDIVRLALETLSERQRMAVLLNKFEGLSYADIAQIMEMSPQAVKSLLSRARVNLRQILIPYLESGKSPEMSLGNDSRQAGADSEDDSGANAK
ncbi:MAG: sigma-70 family RNA polymerase sigma factor [Thermoguttaceae bacterium]|nr:sigma-70 family RNA polymerase sigma factor [Thermoguttaceae bacterium]MDW8036873.1 sigma-70 family RNA polymerase sigma factor [Thermoguttaceae bacterium]